MNQARLVLLASVLGLILPGCFDASVEWTSLSTGSSAAETNSKLNLNFIGGVNSPSRFEVGERVDPPPQVSVTDMEGRAVTDLDHPITLAVFSDSSCTQLMPNGENISQAPAIDGIATFEVDTETMPGLYFLQAWSMDSRSPCSHPVEIVAGPPDRVLFFNRVPSVSVGSINELTVQTADRFGNPSPGVGFVFFTVLNPVGDLPSKMLGHITTPNTATDTQGIATVTFIAPQLGENAVVQARFRASGEEMAGPASIISYDLTPGPIDHAELDYLPSVVLKNHNTWVRVSSKDSHGNTLRNYGGSATLQVDGNSSIPVGFGTVGTIFTQISFSNPATPQNLSLAPDGGLDSRNYQTRVDSPTCYQAFEWRGDTSSQWNETNWIDQTFGPSHVFVNVPNSTNAGISAEFNTNAARDCVMSSAWSMGCVHLDAHSLTLESTLTLSGSDFRVAGGSLHGSGGINFQPASETPQYFSGYYTTGGAMDANIETFYVDKTVNTPLTFEGGGGGSLTRVGNITFPGSGTRTVYINGDLLIRDQPLIIPPGITIIVNPGGNLIATHGIEIQAGAKLELVGNAQVLLSGGSALQVLGSLKLEGSNSLRPHIGLYNDPVNPTLSYGLQILGVVDAINFDISDTDVNGVHFMTGSHLKRFSNGGFHRIARGLGEGYAIRFANDPPIDQGRYLWGLQFSNDVLRDNVKAIDASGLAADLPIARSMGIRNDYASWPPYSGIDMPVGPPSGAPDPIPPFEIKERVDDPNGLLVWEY